MESNVRRRRQRWLSVGWGAPGGKAAPGRRDSSGAGGFEAFTRAEPRGNYGKKHNSSWEYVDSMDDEEKEKIFRNVLEC